MKKSNNKGFMLTETLIVSTFITVALLYMFVQFRQVYQNYNRTFLYNTVSSLYAVDQIRTYILDVDFDTMKSTLTESSDRYLNLTDCPNSLFAESTYCISLFESLDVKNAYFTYDDISELGPHLKLDYTVDPKTITFLNYINYEKNSSDFRLIVHFNDDTHATLMIGQEGTV